MKKTLFLAIFFLFNFPLAHAGAGGHAGHGGGGGGGGASCIKPRLNKFTPEHLAIAAPESEFSFWAFNIQQPEDIEVTVKNMPVHVTFENKDAFYLVKGKLPASLSNTTARISIKVNSKVARCDAEGGWLVNIADK
jgi:hypothetical protein